MNSTQNSYSPLEAGAIRDLQALAMDASRRPARRSRRSSRAAQLHLIDLLSRYGGAGVALLFGATIFNAVLVGQAHPARAAVSAGMVFAALYVARRFCRAFRSGEEITSHPFRWRAYYTATLSVAGAAFGAGAVLLLPEGAAAADAYQILGVMFAAALAASALHAAHLKSAAAIGLPAATLIAAGAALQLGVAGFLVVAALSIFAAAGIVFASRLARENAATRFPRTGFVRKSFSAQQQPSEAKAAQRLSAAG